METTPTVCEIRTFGQFEVRREGALLTQETARSQKTWDLLQFLITHRSNPVSTESIIDALWPDDDHEASRHALRTLVYRLRKAMALDGDGNGTISSIGSGYMFTPNGKCFLDVQEFEKLTASGRLRDDAEDYARAIELYRGEYLGSAPYAPWAITKRSHYRRQFIDAVGELLRLYRRDNRMKDADRLCEYALLLEPLDEHINIKHLELLMVNGQYSRAKEHYSQFTARLYNELGVKPSYTLRAMYDNIRRHDGANGSSSRGESPPTDGALVCAGDVFASLAELEGRRGARHGYGVFVANFSFTGTRIDPDTQEAALRLLTQAMRKGDAVAPMPGGDISLLLTNLNAQQLPMVLARLQASLTTWAQHRGLTLDATTRQLSS